MEDIAPKLLEQIKNSFHKDFNKSTIIKELYAKIRDGTATYIEANEFAIETGKILADTFAKNISSDILPEGRMFYNIADRVISEMMKNNYELIADVSEEVQNALNKSSGLGINAIRPELNKDRIQGIVDRVSNEPYFEDVKWILNEPIKTFSQSIIDDSIKANAEFHYEAGLQPKVIRKVTGDCCDWCKEVSGTYTYPDVPQDVYRRHQRCRCQVDYHPGNGKVQNVHSKKWRLERETDIIEERKKVGILPKSKESPRDKEKRINAEYGLGLADEIASHPKMLAAYTPKGLKMSLEKAGYSVKPMNGGNFKGIPFEEGGGYKVNFGGDGILMYHPEQRSHHGGAYFKISTGKGGTRRYDTKGNEIKKDK